MTVLRAAARKASATVVVGGKPKFPVPDKGHARAALARINQAKPPLTPAQKARVEAKADRVLGIKPGSPADKARDAAAGSPERPVHRTFIHTGKRNGTTRLRPAKAAPLGGKQVPLFGGRQAPPFGAQRPAK